MEVQSIALNSANVRYNNANDESRVYDITADVFIQNNGVNNFESGTLAVNDVVKVTFNIWGETLNCSFNDVAVEEQCQMLQAIHEFADSVKASVTTNTISL